LASGYVGHRLVPGKPVTSQDSKVFSASADAESSSSSGSNPGAPTATAARTKTGEPVSTDTLESVMAIEGDPSFKRLAAWMMQASEPEIAAYWQFYRQKKDRSNEINDLIFIHWTRLDPKAAIAASTGTPDEHYAWWAWACHDPKQALATAVSDRPDRINNVAWGLGEFHANWVMEHFQEIPEGARDNAIRGMVKWDDSPDPKRILDFLRENGKGFNQRMFKSLVRKDPWEAYEWIKANGSAIANYGGPEFATRALVDTMKDSSPEMLEQFASRLPAGDMKRKVEAVLFEALVVSDPNQALAQASATKSSAVAVERFATLALALSKMDPGRALEVARRMFEANPAALISHSVIEGPGSMSYTSSSDQTAMKLVDRLLAIDPAAVMEMQSVSAGRSDASSFQTVASKWAEQDFPAYAEWVNNQTVPEVRDEAAGVVISRLRSDAHYEEALEWAMSSEKLRRDHLLQLATTWNRSDPEGAGVWLKSAPLTESERENFQSFIKP
jgi:hypothetical protein